MYESLTSTFDKTKLALTEAQWVRSESMRQVMENVVRTQMLLFCAMIAMTFLLYNHQNRAEVLVWFCVNGISSVLRLWFLRGYNHFALVDQLSERVKYFNRYVPLAPFNGFIWGISVYLFNGQVSANIAIFCLLVVLIFGLFSVFNLSSYLKLMNRFMWAYCAGLISGVLLHIAVVQNYEPDTLQMWFLTMIVVFVFMMFRIGIRMNQTTIEGLSLQYRNKQLIASLTDQRETALAAVATKNRMLASAAHDMRQPVLALDIYAGWLVEEPASSTEIAPKIAASTKAVISLFDSMFDMSRLSEGQISTHLTAVKVEEIIDNLFLQYQPLAQAKGLTLRTRSVAGSIFTDALLLERILGNLLNNAIKYTHKGGVLLACRETHKGVQIEVWDTGVGISADQQSLVFKEFYKSPSNAGTSDGFGLGLAIVTQLSELLGAEIKLRSRRGQGTVVSLQLGKMI
jgi:signal transduction histidine kinase